MVGGEMFGVVMAISVPPYASTHASQDKPVQSYLGMYNKDFRSLRWQLKVITKSIVSAIRKRALTHAKQNKTINRRDMRCHLILHFIYSLCTQD